MDDSIGFEFCYFLPTLLTNGLVDFDRSPTTFSFRAEITQILSRDKIIGLCLKPMFLLHCELLANYHGIVEKSIWACKILVVKSKDSFLPITLSNFIQFSKFFFSLKAYENLH